MQEGASSLEGGRYFCWARGDRVGPILKGEGNRVHFQLGFFVTVQA